MSVLRPRRKSADPGVVAVTGAATGLGRALLARLAERDDLAGLVGIDTVRAPLDTVRAPHDPMRAPHDRVQWRRGDPGVAASLEGVTTVVHLATSYDLALPAATRRALNVRGTERVLAAAREAGVARVVLCTSSEVYGALPGNQVPLPDAAPLLAEPGDNTLCGDHLQVEALAERAGVSVTVLRPATLVGLSASYDGQVLRQLAGPRLLAVRGIEPLWQLCHVEDLVSALELAAVGVVSGGLGVASVGALPQAAVEEIAGRRRLELPATIALSTAERLHRLGVTTSSPRELDHLLGPLVVACDGLREAGWSATWTNDAALRAHLAERRPDSRAPAYTAAGATVALLGSAALVRRARKRRRGRSAH